MIDKTHLNLEGAKLYLFLYFYWELVLGTMLLGVCAVVCLRASFWELTVTGSLCWDFFV